MKIFFVHFMVSGVNEVIPFCQTHLLAIAKTAIELITLDNKYRQYLNIM